MRTLGLLLSTAGLAGTGFVLPVTAHAAPSPVTSTQANCGGVKIISAAPVRRNWGSNAAVGSIQLKRDACSNYWAEVIAYDKVVKFTKFKAFLLRYRGNDKIGTNLSCEVPAGSARTCATASVSDPNGGLTFLAIGNEYNGSNNGWASVSKGQTAKVR